VAPPASALPARQLLPRQERQASILNGAAQAFAGKGFAGTSMEEVAGASGITKLIVYRHFESKGALYRAVLDRTFRMLADELARGRRRSSERTPGLRAVLSVGRSFPDGLRLLLVHAPREPEFAEYAADIRARIVESVRGRTGLDDPLFRRWGAEVTVSCVFDAVLTWLALGEPERDEEFMARCGAGLLGMLAGWQQSGS
jgi:AcrR family transcriptional regulator